MIMNKLYVAFMALITWTSVVAAGPQGTEPNGCRQHPLGPFSDWSAPVNLGPGINTQYDDYHPAISNDGLTLYFTSNRPGGFSEIQDIWVSQRASLTDPWGAPRNLGPNINSAAGTCCPNLTPDEHWLFFASDRPEGIGGASNLWVSHRESTQEDFGLQPPVNLGPLIHSDQPGVGECAPTYFEDRQTGTTSLYFCRDQGGVGDFDI